MDADISRAVDWREPRVRDWLYLIRSEYLEMPGLCLTLPQARRFWGLDEVTASALFGALVDVGFLRCTHTGTYVRS
jgi:hypothetical protein